MRPNEPTELTPDQRTAEIARLLAAGVQRLFSRRADAVRAPLTASEKSQESAESGLEVGRETRLSGPTG
jgi:hypothetical protein